MEKKDQILDTLPNYDADNAQMPNEVSGLNTQFEGNPFAQQEGTAAGAVPAGTAASATSTAGGAAPASTAASGRPIGRAASQLKQKPWQAGLLLLAGWLAFRGLRRRGRISRLS